MLTNFARLESEQAERSTEQAAIVVVTRREMFMGREADALSYAHRLRNHTLVGEEFGRKGPNMVTPQTGARAERCGEERIFPWQRP